MRRLYAFISLLLITFSSHAEALKLPGFPEIPDSLLVINTTKTPKFEKCTALNLESGEHNLLGTLHLPTSPMPEGGYPAVILFHGFRGSKVGGLAAAYRKLAREFTKAGIACVRFDMAGCGDSEGIGNETPIRTYLKNGEDILQAVTQHPEINPFRLGIAGFSLGCHTAFHLARIYSPNDFHIRSMTIWAPVADGGILFKEMYESVKQNSDVASDLGKDFGFDPLPLVVCEEDIYDFLKLQDHVVLNSLPQKIAILHLQGSEDNLVSLTQQALFKNTAPGNIEFKTYEKTNHNLESSPDMFKIIQDIVAHFQLHL
ncbi:alpha/beta hydrolase [Chlamydia vaughanii]|uniref:alpha/beta hydrolase n=1 Tax=Chlamydia vaughanii TaxID=3112552 RepID=UPI0032B1D13B